MEKTTDAPIEPAKAEPVKKRGGGYLITIIGADIGFVIGAVLGLIVSFSQFQTDAVLSFTNLAVILAAIVSIGIGGLIGGILGSYIALSVGGYDRKGRTALFLAFLYPIPLLLAGSDLFIGALLLPLLARWLALRNL